MRFGLRYRESILTVVCDDGLRDAAFDAMMEGGSFYDESQLDAVERFCNPSAA